MKTINTAQKGKSDLKLAKWPNMRVLLPWVPGVFSRNDFVTSRPKAGCMISAEGRSTSGEATRKYCVSCEANRRNVRHSGACEIHLWHPG